MRYLAVDYGSKRIGLAICDPTETIVSPLAVIRTGKDLLRKISEVVKREQIGAIVLGLPLNMDDSQGPQAKLVLKFAEKLRNSLHISVHLQDERLSSFAAEEELFSAGLPRNRVAQRLDAVAAAEILKAYLEQKGPDKSA
ncbi:MAG: Holliday junction resolvase RuvX [Sedimentisphaerales bacterium]|nr:Holliday junction resolvase RuvX [Sedimentisphaerales bacterium]